jgi:hypothetical protein
MNNKLVIDVDGEIIIYYEGILKATEVSEKIIRRNSFLKIPVPVNPNIEPVEADLDSESLINIAAAIISIYPERSRIIEAPTYVIEQLYPEPL